MQASAWLDAVGNAHPDAARESFLREHAAEVYAALTDDLATALRVEDLVARAAERFPGLVPTGAQLEDERQRALADKEGVEIAQGLLLAHVLASPRAGDHLLWAMRRPTTEAARARRACP